MTLPRVAATDAYYLCRIVRDAGCAGAMRGKEGFRKPGVLCGAREFVEEREVKELGEERDWLAEESAERRGTNAKAVTLCPFRDTSSNKWVIQVG
eukprot:575675-Hanusia_phi.AAC.1